MSQDSIVIFRSYIDAIAELPAELYKEVSRVLYAYAFDGIEPGDEASPTARALFIALKSQIDFNVARYERAVRNGSKGGAPKGTRNNPNGRRGKRTNQELTETNQELTNPEKLVISDVSGVEAVEILPEGEEENTPNLPKIRRKGFVKTNQELTQNKPRTNQDGEKELTDAKELTLISNQLSINNYVVVDNAREVSFLDKFFAPENQYSLDVLCMQNSTDVETLKQYANEIIAEWQLRGVEHTEYKEAAQHLINHLRRKFEADRRRAREDAAAPKSRRQARQDLMQGAAERMARTIKSDGSAASPSTAGDTEPF
jgi:hypothetical protein|nr:MAG TPA: hypothetical protein [Caudoviricetes sp.]